MRRLGFVAVALALAALSISRPVWADTAGAVQPGNLASQSDLGGCLYETSPASASSGQQRAVHCDVNGNVSVAPASGTTFSATQSGTNVSVTPTIQNASYASGNCMGGFQTVAMGSAPSVLNQVTLASKGGLATAKQVYLFSANPTGSTCTDKSTFTIAAADVSKVMVTFSVTPAAPTGTTITFGSAGGQGLGIPAGGTFYAAIVETTTETPASTTDLVLNFSGF